MALGDVIARLAVSLSLDTAAFEQGATIAEKRMEQTRKRLQKTGDQMVGLGGKISLAIGAPLAALAKASISAAIESQEAIGQVDSALKSMGNTAGRTSEQLQGLATGLMRQSLFDDDEILRKVTANLLTFGNISGQAFDRAQAAAVNLSARLGQDLQASTIQIGKALNDPIKGVTALQRVGVSFTAQQREQIKAMVEAGNAAGAQAMILKELEREFGGAAQAARDANPTAAMKQSWDEFQETLGAKLLPLLPRITEALTKILDAFGKLSPQMQTAVVIGGALAIALGPILIAVGSLIPLMVSLAPAVSAVGAALLFIAANPVILGLAAVLLGIVFAARHWDEITAIAKRVYNGVKTWLLDKLESVWNSVKAKIDAVKGWFFGLYDAVIGHSYIPDMVDGIAAEMARLDAVLVQPVQKATSKAAQAIRDLAQEGRELLARLFPEVEAANGFESNLKTIERLGLSAEQTTEAVMRLWRALGSGDPQGTSLPEPNFGDTDILKGFDIGPALDDFIKKLPQAKEKLGEFKDAAHDAFGELAHQIKGVLLGFQSVGDAIRNLVSRLADMALDWAFKALGTAIGVPGFASGTSFAPGGLALVGERGPELVNLPRGSQVHTTSETQRMLGGGQPVHFHFPGVTTERQAREAGAQAALRFRQLMNGPVRA